jgi:hypothetical protein
MLIKLAIAMLLVLCVVPLFSEQSSAQKKRNASSKSNGSTSGSREVTLSNEARKIASQYWEKYLIKCGRSYFLYSDVRLFEFRDQPQFSFSGHALAPTPLSRAEILNGVDPLPIEWDGSIGVSFGVCRMNTASYGYGQTYWDGWGAWNSHSCGYSTRLSRVKGQWNLTSSKQTSCDQLLKWGFVFIPESVRGAKAEARAEYDAATKAMLASASRLGLVVSNSPQFPRDQFRRIYEFASRRQMSKVKVFGSNVVILSGGENGIPKELTTALDNAMGTNHGIYEVAFGPNGEWIIVGTISRAGGDAYMYAAKNAPQSLIRALEDLRSQSSDFQHYIDMRLRPWSISLGPNGQWLMLFGTGPESNMSGYMQYDVESSIRQVIEGQRGHKLKQFVFDPTGGYLILFDTNYYVASAEIPRDLTDRLAQLSSNAKTIDEVVFAPNGAWIIRNH